MFDAAGISGVSVYVAYIILSVQEGLRFKLNITGKEILGQVYAFWQKRSDVLVFVNFT